MDPQASMMNHAGGFQSPPFNLAEIWQFPINAGGDATAYSFPSSTAAAAVHNVSDVPNNDPMVLDRRTTNYSGGGGGSARKRNEEDESAKGVSTSGNGLVFYLIYLIFLLVSCINCLNVSKFYYSLVFYQISTNLAVETTVM